MRFVLLSLLFWTVLGHNPEVTDKKGLFLYEDLTIGSKFRQSLNDRDNEWHQRDKIHFKLIGQEHMAPIPWHRLRKHRRQELNVIKTIINQS